MASKEQLRKIALYCDEYKSITNDEQRLTSSYEDKYENCTNCKHYSDNKCKLDLIDKVLSSMSMEEDFKS
ncbi:MAG: hypothetical protein PHY91_02010 [Tissierellia bacterium]|nr:hypothetical protein [Tissierellia bacterium]MDD4725804.1 hypothetical protein [Tissierellia bacterium]